jgi:hypothetical protein
MLINVKKAQQVSRLANQQWWLQILTSATTVFWFLFKQFSKIYNQNVMYYHAFLYPD